MKRERLVRNEQTGEFEWQPIEKAIHRDERKLYSTRFSTPEISTAAGCHSGQVSEFNEFYKERGITGAYHRPDGALVYEDNNSRNRVLQERGLYDREAGYGEWAGNASDED